MITTTTTEDLVIKKEMLETINMSRDEVLIELAAHLYETKRLTMGQAKRMAGLDQISFQKELAKRDIYIHMTVEDVMGDVERLRTAFKK